MPNIHFVSPSANEQFHVLDTISVQFEASDNCCLLSGSVKIVDQNFIPVTSTVNLNLSSNPFYGFVSIPIDNKEIETGDYFILISVSDNLNVQLQYQEVRIIGIPKERRGVFASTYSESPSSQIFKIDSQFQTSSVWNSLNQDVLKCCVNSLDNELSLIGHYSEYLRTFSVSDLSEVWTSTAYLVSQTSRFLDLLCYDRQVYATLYDREVRGFNSTGGLNLTLFTGDYRPNKLYRSEDYLVTGQELVGTNSKFLFVHYALSGALRWQQQLPIEIVAFCELDNNEVLVFGNDGNQAKVYEVNLSENTYWEPRQLPLGRILDAVKLSNQSYSIAHENGIYHYTYNPNFLDLVRPVLYQDLEYDVDYNLVVGASGNQLHELSINGQLLNSISLSDSIGSLDIYYTR